MSTLTKIFFSCTIILFFTSNLTICAQIECIEESTKEKEVKKCFHANGRVSSLVEWEKERKWGKLTIYSSNGTKIQDWELRKIHGIAKAELEYHKNGQVSKVIYSSAPDAGIQRFERVYYFNQDGNLTNTEKNDYPPKLSDFIQVEESIPQENKTQCAEIWISKLEIINNSKRTQKLKITPLLPNSLAKAGTITLKPKQKATVDSCIQAQFFQDPINQTQINYLKSNKKAILKFKESIQISRSQKTFIYEIVN
jgi:hypothetical protein